MTALAIRFVDEEAGQDLIEYGLLIGIITLGAMLSIQSIGSKIAVYFGNLDTNLP